jgi:hypothetical protein
MPETQRVLVTGSTDAETRCFSTMDIETPYHSTWLDNTKAKFLLAGGPNIT